MTQAFITIMGLILTATALVNHEMGEAEKRISASERPYLEWEWRRVGQGDWRPRFIEVIQVPVPSVSIVTKCPKQAKTEPVKCPKPKTVVVEKIVEPVIEHQPRHSIEAIQAVPVQEPEKLEYDAQKMLDLFLNN